jgi:hypothetical protein
MNGPIRNQSDKLGTLSTRLEFSLIVAGVMVVGGLVLEYWRDIAIAFTTRTRPSVETVGGILITAGVFVEVVLGIFVTRTAKALERIANSAIAEANARAAQAREKTAASELEIARITAGLQPRHIVFGAKDDDGDKRQALFAAVRAFAGTGAMIQSIADPEAEQLAYEIGEVCRISGWQAVRVTPEESGISPGAIGSGVTVGTYEGGLDQNSISKRGRAAEALVNLLALDLRPPYASPKFGVRWSVRRGVRAKDLPPNGFVGKDSDDVVTILVGPRPLEALTSPAQRSQTGTPSSNPPA